MANRKTDDSQNDVTLPYLTLPYLTLPYLTLPYLTYLPYLTLPYLTLPYLTLPYLTLPYLTLPCLTLPYLTLLYLTLPHLTSPHLTSPHLTSPHLTSPHLTSPYLGLNVFVFRCSQNDGQCVDGVLNYTCKCAQGFRGRHCEIGKISFNQGSIVTLIWNVTQSLNFALWLILNLWILSFKILMNVPK